MRGSPYTDLTRPPLRAEALRRALVVPGARWTDLRVVAETGSTNADVAAAAQAGAGEGLVVVAEAQTAGRGRLDRTWLSPPRAGLSVSVLLRPPVPVARLGWLPLLAGVALVEAVGRVAVVDAVLKWPNDLLVRTASGEGAYGKCAGILAEVVPGPVAGHCATSPTSHSLEGLRPSGVDGPAVVLGIGLNVSQRANELPPPPDPDAIGPTSLALAGAANADRDPLLRALLRSLDTWYGRWSEAGGAGELLATYRRICQTLGEEVAVALPGGELVRGRADDVDEDGQLRVVTAAGVRVLAAGDVLRVR